jgi:hypothetical protein
MMLETTEAQISFIKQAIDRAIGNTTGHTQLGLKEASGYIPKVQVAWQNLKARVDTLDAE